MDLVTCLRLPLKPVALVCVRRPNHSLHHYQSALYDTSASTLCTLVLKARSLTSAAPVM